jgi:hypothetical protein
MRIAVASGTMTQTFHGGEHGNGGRNHRIAVEHGGAEETGHQQQMRNVPAILLVTRTHQRRQRNDAAFAFVVRAHHVGHVLAHHDDHHGPDDHRQDTEHNGRIHHARFAHALPQGIDRAGADIAEHDAQRAEHQSRQRSIRGSRVRLLARSERAHAVR